MSRPPRPIEPVGKDVPHRAESTTGKTAGAGGGDKTSLWAVILPPVITGVLGILGGAITAGWHPLEQGADRAGADDESASTGVGFRAYWLADPAASYSNGKCVSDTTAILAQSGFADPSMREEDVVSGYRNSMTARVSCKNAGNGYVFLALGLRNGEVVDADTFLNAFGTRLAEQAQLAFEQSW